MAVKRNKSGQFRSRSQVHPKVQAAGVAGAAVTLLVIVLTQFGVQVPNEAIAPATTLLGALAGWLRPS